VNEQKKSGMCVITYTTMAEHVEKTARSLTDENDGNEGHAACSPDQGRSRVKDAHRHLHVGLMAQSRGDERYPISNKS
jgi:hypothetical protein